MATTNKTNVYNSALVDRTEDDCSAICRDVFGRMHLNFPINISVLQWDYCHHRIPLIFLKTPTAAPVYKAKGLEPGS